MVGTELTYADIVALYKHKFTQNAYPFKHADNPNSDFNLYEWVKIKLKLDKIHCNLLPFIIAINEIFRFEIGNTQPECRLSDTHILSKKVEQDDDVGQFRVKTLYAYWDTLIHNKNIFWEGIGRVVFCKYLYQENDFNIYNALLNKNNYFIGIDPETCFWSITEKYHYGTHYKPSNVKVLAYKPATIATYTTVAPTGNHIYLIPNKTRDFIGELHLEDYETLPNIKYFYPANWFFLTPELKYYTRALAKNKGFLNEKYFATLKAIVTICMKQLLIDLHIEDKNDNEAAQKFITSQLFKLTEIIQYSAQFMQYLQMNKILAMQTILDEMQRYFTEIKAYTLEDTAMQLRLQKYFYHDAIQQYEALLVKLNMPLLNEEKIALSEYPLH